MDLFKDLLSRVLDIERRLGTLESTNQFRQIIVKDNSSTPRVFIDGVNGVIKVSRAGFDVTTTPNVNLSFNSNFSMFREVQMQCVPSDEFTNSTSWVEYFDAQIQINFADWTDCNMYFEGVMKTGGGIGYDRLWNMTDSSQLVQISTTATVATSVRSGVITKPSTGVKSFRVSQQVSSGSFYTDLYIGRVIMRYDF